MEQRGRDLTDLWESSFSEEQDQITELEAVLQTKKFLLGLRLGYRPRFWNRMVLLRPYDDLVLHRSGYPGNLKIRVFVRTVDLVVETDPDTIRETWKVNQDLGLVSWIQTEETSSGFFENILFVIPVDQVRGLDLMESSR